MAYATIDFDGDGFRSGGDSSTRTPVLTLAPELAHRLKASNASPNALYCLLEDGVMDWSKSPDVESRPGVVSGAFVVVGTRVPADAVIDNAEDGFTAEEIVADIYPTVPLDRARRIIEFARRHDARLAG
jgi:uncharacterized protein (DUF433 family)